MINDYYYYHRLSPEGQGEGRGGARRVIVRGHVGDFKCCPVQGRADVLPL